MPQLFLTDYASYNEDSQLKFGHWVDLDDFSDANEFWEYCKEHFSKCDKESPLKSGEKRESYMYTTYEDIPEGMISEHSFDAERYFEYQELEDHEQVQVAYLLKQGNSVKYAMDNYMNVTLFSGTVEEVFAILYPSLAKLADENYYLDIDYNGFETSELNEFVYEGKTYYSRLNSPYS